MKIIEEKYSFAHPLAKRAATEHLILHHSAVKGISAQTIHSGHLANGWSGIAYHYYVRANGDVYRGRPEDTQGGHTKNMNERSIGICFEGNFDGEEMSAEQFEAGRALIADICSRYEGIKVSRHSDHNATACPGLHFPFDEICKPLSKEKDEPSEWARDAARWAADKGIFCGDGDGDFRWHDYITREEMAVLLRRVLN